MTHSVFTGVHECMKTQMYTDQQETIRTHGGCHAQVNQATESPCPAIRQQVRTFHHVMSKKCHPGCDADPGARSQSTDLFVFDGFDCLCMIESACTCVYLCIFVYIYVYMYNIYLCPPMSIVCNVHLRNLLMNLNES